MKIIKSIFLGIFYLFFVVFAVAMTVCALNFNKFGLVSIKGYTMVIVKDKVSLGDYKNGDVVITQKQRIANLKSEDEILVYQVKKKNKINIIMGKIGQTQPKDNTISLKNGEIYSSDFIIGTEYKVIPQIGKILGLILTRWTFLFVVVVPLFFVFISQIYSLIVEIKYGGNDE